MHQTKFQGEVHRMDRLFGKLTKTQQMQTKLGRDVGKRPGWISATGEDVDNVHSKMSKSIPRSAAKSNARHATLMATSQDVISNITRGKKPQSAPATSLRTIRLVKGPLSLKNGASSERNQEVDEVTCDPVRRIQALYSQGLLYQKENKLKLAIDSYEAAIRIPASGREFASLYINLGSAQMEQLRFGDALVSFQNAERIHPTNVKAVYNSALALMHLGDATKAEEQVRLSVDGDKYFPKSAHT
uniref:Uncharacterized protein n=1 Tax=Globisporangium ultimum (strain ATCC 200006 / CBS 805.95 / DAOM BR144) TaxID=431595 RepID=K3WB26_GLOUD